MDFLIDHWLAILLVGMAALSGCLAVWSMRRYPGFLLPLLILGGSFFFIGVGAIAVPANVAFWMVVAAGVILTLMLVVVVLTGHWWAPLAYATASSLLLGLGGLYLQWMASGLAMVLQFVRSLEVAHAGWLALLVLVPLVVMFSFRSLAGLGPVRRVIAIALRCCLLVLLTMALSEVRASHPGTTTTVFFVVDCSYSMPEAVQPVVEEFVNAMAESRSSSEYQVGTIYFGAQPRLVRSATDAPRINVNYQDAQGNIERGYTDLAAALKLALASFPEGSSKRVVLLSDGNENRGNAEDQARLARLNGVQIDVVPIGAGRRKENEVLLQSIEAPPEVEEGAALLIQVALRSFNPNIVTGTLTVKQRMDVGELVNIEGSPRKNVQLRQGMNTVFFEQPRRDPKEKQGSYTYVAEFIPEFVLAADGRVLSRGLPGDLKQNNTAITHVVARRAHNRVLLLEPHADDFKFLEANLPTAKNPATRDRPRYEFDRRPISNLPREELGAFLSGYDCVILANMPAQAVDEQQQELLRSNTHDQGCGLIMVGGPDSFGAGAWQGTRLEEALPVDTDIKSFKVQGKVGLVLIMHASEMPKGNYWQKEIAKLAIKELSRTDEVGILYYDGLGGTRWHFKLQDIGENRDLLLSKVDSLAPGDMPDFDPSLKLAHEALSDPGRNFVGKHVILISDGDPVQNDKMLLSRMKQDHVTVTTIGVATHGAPQDQHLMDIAQATGGRFYNVKNPSALPSIYLKETRLISQDFLYQKAFRPELPWATGPAEGLKAPLPSLTGFVRTTAKPKAVTVPIDSPEIAGHRFPILAYWHYGLGKVVAFTSDAAPHDDPEGKVFWARAWSEAGIYGKFWEQMIDHALRPVESKALSMVTETRDGKTRVIVSARDKDGRPINNLTLRGALTTPGGAGDAKRPPLKFEQTGAGRYEAEFKAEESGSYFINAQAVRRIPRPRTDASGKPLKDNQGNPIREEVEEGFDSTRGGVTVPYSPEFAEVESNPILLERLREATGGMTYSEEALRNLYASALQAGRRPEKELVIGEGQPGPGARSFRSEAGALAQDVFRPGPPATASQQPIWFWLVFLTGTLLFFDVAVRRISLEPRAVLAGARNAWERVRGRASMVLPSPEFFDRLRNRKAQVEESLTRPRSDQRFEPGPGSVSLPPGVAEAPSLPSATPSTRPSPPPLAPEQAPEPGDYASRLLKAKKKVWQDREREEPKQDS